MLMAAAVACSQTPGATPVSAAAFDVASVKPSVSPSGGGSLRWGPASVSARNVTLRRLVLQAYGLEQYYQILGGPAWSSADRYDVDAKAASAVAPDQLRQMLRALLSERFRLVTHREERQVSGYALVVGKKGPKVYHPGDARNPATNPAHAQRLPVTMKNLAAYVAKMWDQPVVDETGLEGVYEVVLSWPEERDPDVTENMRRALEPEGLELEARSRVPVEYLVIDRASKPAPNP